MLWVPAGTYTLAWLPLIRQVRSGVVKESLFDVTLLPGLSLHRGGMGGLYWWSGGQVQRQAMTPSSLTDGRRGRPLAR